MLFRSLTKTGLGLFRTGGLLRQPIYKFSQNNRFDQNNPSEIFNDGNFKTSHVVANNVGLSKFLNR